MPTYVSNTNFTASAGSHSQLQCTYAPTVGNAVIFAVRVNATQVSVTSVFDSAGNDIFGNPLNVWQNLGTVSVGGQRYELWGCVSIAVAISSFTIVLSSPVTLIDVDVLQYSGVSAFVSSGTASNSGYNDLFFNAAAQSNQNMLVCMFAEFSANSTNIASGGGIPHQTITAATTRLNLQGMLLVEQTVIVNELLTAQVVCQTGTSLGLAGIGVVLTGGVVLPVSPGFADINEANLNAGQICTALKLSQIAQNAALGIVRPEFFISLNQDGDEVPTPISPVDQYQYQRTELIYIYTPLTTFDPSAGWPSAQGILFYAQWFVDQATGKVTCSEYYHVDGNPQPSSTKDGQLVVLTVAQRAGGDAAINVPSGLVISNPPGCFTIDTSLEGQDKPVTQSLLQALVRTSKFAAVKAEVFFCGEFVDGQVVPPPVSQADSYQYDYSEVKFLSSWKWTTNQGSFQSPPFASANGGNADGGWSQMNEMKASVDASGNVTCRVTFYNHGVIDPTTGPNGGQAYGRLLVFAFCQRHRGPVFKIPGFNSTLPRTATETWLQKVDVPVAATGTLKIQFQAGTSAGIASGKACIKKTLAGSLSVVSTTNLTFSSSGTFTIAANGSITSDPISSWVFDTAHDYYIMVVTNNGDAIGVFTGQTAGGLDNTSPIQYAVIAGDQSGAASINSSWVAPAALAPENIFVVSKISLDLTETTSPAFVNIPLSALMPGNPLSYTTMQTLAANVRAGSKAVEYFGPTNYVGGNTVPVPTSPIDGYVYSRSELTYIWQWHDTGTAAIRLLGFGASIDQNGLISSADWHVPTGGPPTDYGTSTLPHTQSPDGSIDVIVIAQRSQYAAGSRQTPPAASAGTTGGPPTDVNSMPFGGKGGFTVNSI